MTAGGVNPLAGFAHSAGLSVRDPDPLADRSWQREMERAQIAAWLCHDVVGITGGRPGGESVALSHLTAPPTAGAYSTPMAGFAAEGVPSAEDRSALEGHPDAGGVTRNAFPRSMPPDAPVAGLSGYWHEERDAQHYAAVSAVGAGLVETVAAPAPLAHRELAHETARWQWQGESLAALPGLQALQAASRQTLATISTTPSDGELAGARGKHAAGYAGGGQPADAMKLQASPPAGACAPAPHEVGKKLFDLSMPAAQASPLDLVHKPPLTQPVSRFQAGTTAAAAGDKSRQLSLSTDFAAVIREPVRLHADWSAEGVRLWLGMDAPQATALQVITTQLQRWLSAQGVRLLSISCNGRLVHDLSDTAGAAIFEAQIAPAETLEPRQPPFIVHVKESP